MTLAEERQRLDLDVRIMEKKGFAAALFGVMSHATISGSRQHGKALYDILQAVYRDIELLETQKAINAQQEARYS
jgi:hypothetical protein